MSGFDKIFMPAKCRGRLEKQATLLEINTLPSQVNAQGHGKGLQAGPQQEFWHPGMRGALGIHLVCDFDFPIMEEEGFSSTVNGFAPVSLRGKTGPMFLISICQLWSQH